MTPSLPTYPETERWRTLICSYSWDCDWAMYVMRRESNGDPDAYNPVPLFVNGEESHALCLMGMAYPLHIRFFSGPWNDPEVCVAAAFGLYQEQGEQPWRLN